MATSTLIDSIHQSMQDSVVQVRCSSGRKPSPVTREQALAQVEMLEKAKQQYIQCERLATNSEILDYIASKGLQPNKDDFKESFINDRIILEDMHPANVFIDIQSGKPVCIDCIVKFR